MTPPNENVTLDSEGIPILTEVIPAAVVAAQPAPAALSVDDIAANLIESEEFQKSIDEIAAKLTVNMRVQISETIKPAIEEAITRALNTSGDNTFTSIRAQLEAMLPEMLTRTMTQITDGE
ncbi:MAG: hypothetical protein WBN51_10845 [Gammaproteobacteria bacterium]